MRTRSLRVLLLALTASAAGLGRVSAQGPPLPPDMPVPRLGGPAQAIPTAGPGSWPPTSPAMPSAVHNPQAGQGGTRPSTLPVTTLDERKPATDLDAPRSVSIAVSRPVSVRSLLLLLVRGTGFSVVPEEHVSGTFSGTLKGLTMRQALEAVLFPRSLDYDVRGTVIRVFPRKPMTRLFDLNYVSVRRAGTDFFQDVTDGVTALLSTSGRAHVDRLAGLVQVTDFTDRLDRVAAYLEALQVRATRQVLIDARVFAFTPAEGTGVSVNWGAIVSRPGGGIRPTAGQTGAGFQVNDVAALMKSLGEQGSVRVVASPHLLAMNNQPALLRVGAEVERDEVVADVRADVARAPDVLEGFTVSVTAQVGADGVVQLHVAPAYTEDGLHMAAMGRDVAVRQISEADTVLRVRDGETVVLSGFLQERVKDARPGSAAARSDLVILLTPTIVAPAAPTGPR